MVTWFAIAAPAKVPAAIVIRLHQEIETIFKRPEMKKLVSSIGGEASVLSPAELRTFIHDETERYRKIIVETGIKIK